MPAWLILIIGVIAISSASILIKMLHFVPALAIASWRLIFASLLTVPFSIKKLKIKRPTASQYFQIFLSGLFLAGHFALWIESLKWTTIASSVILATTTPIWVALISHFFLNEKLSNREWIGIFLAVFGGMLIGYGDLSLSPKAIFGDLLALLAALVITGHLLLGRKLRKNLPVFTYTQFLYFFSALVLMVAALGSKVSLLSYGPREFTILFLLALFPQMIGHTALNWALGHIKATTVAVSVLGEPVGASILAYFIFDELPALPSIIGGIILLAGIYLNSTRKRKKIKPEVKMIESKH